MSDPSETPDKGFVVVDRRASAGGTEATEAPATAAPPPRAAARAPAGSPPRVDFGTLVHSFLVTALYHLGLAADPETGQPTAADLPAARQDIEILEVLQEKTRGNLDAEEARLLESALYELRMRFVEASRAPKT
jgi:hypothetical protein